MKKIILGFMILLMAQGIARGADFLEKKSDHFIVYYKDVPEEFINSVIDFSERYYNDLTEKLGFTRYNYWTWDQRAKIYIYPDQETYLQETKQPGWSSGTASYETKTIWAYPREAGFFDSLLPHEIGHIVFREVIGSHLVPLWMEEGVASYLEQAKRIGARKVVLDSLKDRTFIPLDQLSKIDGYALRGREDVALFYAESVSLISYLIEKFGTSAFNELCRQIKDGKSFEDALSSAYFDVRNLANLQESWEGYLRDQQKR
jgi:hypothetical protein